MRSSTSSSEHARLEEAGAELAGGALARGRTPSFERLTAADRPGIAQPVPERPVPVQPWGRILATVSIVVVLAMVVWEWRMRTLELLPGDLRDSASGWAAQRRRIDTENIQIAIVGDSRILFDTDLDHFEALTGVRPVQLALPGTNARPFLQDLAADPDFKGLVLIGIAEGSYFRTQTGLFADALERYEFESPANRVSFVLYKHLSRWFGFLDGDYRLSRLLQRRDPGLRPKTRGPYQEPWKFTTGGEDRQTALWSRIESDPYLNGHARALWDRATSGPTSTPEVIEMTQRTTREAVAAIRARGGEVVFLRPPSTGWYRERERAKVPREQFWDALIAAADVRGLHFEDDPVERGLYLPELSHVWQPCARVYTDAYVRRVAAVTDRLKLRDGAPPPLAPADCLPANPRMPDGMPGYVKTALTADAASGELVP